MTAGPPTVNAARTRGNRHLMEPAHAAVTIRAAHVVGQRGAEIDLQQHCPQRAPPCRAVAARSDGVG
jgi:hypothetical protein